MITVSSAGRVYIWSIEREESWAAYAPGFVELEENVMYIEPEDEFDTPAAPLLTEEEGPSGEAEDATVDVTTVEKTYLYGDSSGDEDDLTAFYIPVRL
jgi:COMPASS component SWD1